MSRLRSIIVIVAMAIFVIAVTELGVRAFLTGAARQEIAVRKVESVRAPVPESAGASPQAHERIEAEEVLHPYLGYVRRPLDTTDPATLSLETLGFPGGGAFITEADPRKLVVGVFGGSLAAQFVDAGGPQRVFADFAAGREIVVVTTAQGGYKQPQTLLSLAYLMSLGMHFDAVLLLDGFNDVVLPAVENAATFPFFPRLWAWRLAALDVATDVRSVIGEIAVLHRIRDRVATRLQASTLAHSQIATVLWLLFDRSIEAEIHARREDLQQLRPASLDYLASGPKWPRSGDALFADLAGVWKRSAFEMDALCRARGIPFVHFLQPNQYVADSKWMSPEERAIAVKDAHPYRAAVAQGYPALQRAGAELRAAGVAFHDMAGVFAETREVVYADDCCHINARGNEILAAAMAGRVSDDLAPQKPNP